MACSLWEVPDFQALLVEGREGSLSRNGYAAKWAFAAARHPRTALAALLYLGLDIEADASVMFAISRSRRQERRSEQPGRSTYQVPLPVLAAG